MRNPKSKAQPAKAIFATVNQMFGGSFQVVWIVHAQRFDYHSLGSCRKLGGAAENLIDGSEKRICRSSFEFKSSRATERRCNSEF